MIVQITDMLSRVQANLAEQQRRIAAAEGWVAEQPLGTLCPPVPAQCDGSVAVPCSDGSPLRLRVVCPHATAGTCPYQHERDRTARVRHLRSLGFPIAVADPRWDAVAPNIAKGLRLYCDTLPARLARGQGLILGGNVGTGKTSCLALIALAARQRCEAMLLTAGKLFRALARPWEEAAAETLEMAHQVDLLLIDDLGTEAARSESLAAFHEFINGRTGNRRSLCLTTNCRPETLRNMPDLARAFDRIEELNPWLIAEGESRRRKAALQDWLITESEE